MTLGTHAVVGAGLATLVPRHPIAAFLIGFFSHFILDAIPHWDYKILSIKNDEHNKLNTDMVMGRRFIIDLFRISLDISLGLFVAYLLFKTPAYSTPFLFIGAFGAMLPDALQFVYFKYKKEPLKSLQRFHLFIHAEGKIHNAFKGILFQVGIVLIVAVLVGVYQTLIF